jgi:TPP-dependent pyruvate/acetoin dehydrogenase alpha subunit
MAKKGRKKETPEERAEWQKNHDRLQRLLEKRLAQEGVTKEEALSRLRSDA